MGSEIHFGGLLSKTINDS